MSRAVFSDLTACAELSQYGASVQTAAGPSTGLPRDPHGLETAKNRN